MQSIFRGGVYAAKNTLRGESVFVGAFAHERAGRSETPSRKNGVFSRLFFKILVDGPQQRRPGHGDIGDVQLPPGGGGIAAAAQSLHDHLHVDLP